MTVVEDGGNKRLYGTQHNRENTVMSSKSATNGASTISTALRDVPHHVTRVFSSDEDD